MRWLCLSVAVLISGCGARGDVSREVESFGPDARVGGPELCNGLDDDLDGQLDETFRDELGRYVDDQHCGGCGQVCSAQEGAVAVDCGLIAGSPTCVARVCEAGFAPTASGGCRDMLDILCLPCLGDASCGDIVGARCDMSDGGVGACVVPCAAGCSDGYACELGFCQPPGGSCLCGEGDNFSLACGIETDAEAELCSGVQVCRDGVLSACESGLEVCDTQDNDCDGAVDEDWRDSSGAYATSEHCGSCGIDCSELGPVGRDLACGGDPLSPSCVLRCPDTEDGTGVGDRVDADRSIATGCECRIGSLVDEPGPVGASGESLDVNCDGADGDVRQSVYVSVFGDDAAVGSPTRPMRTLQAAIMRAVDSLTSPQPRPHVFVSSGTYVESVRVPDGVLLHGGYRGDFRALDPDGFRVEVRAPTGGGELSLQGAALVIEDAGMTETSIEWMSFRGAPGVEAALGAIITRPRENLILRDVEIVAGRSRIGVRGVDGLAGQAPLMMPAAGQPPRGAEEGVRHTCLPGMANVVSGGLGGANTCEGRSVAGGRGGSPTCPVFNRQQESGSVGEGPGGGPGGAGGHDAIGPLRGRSCDTTVCCGLADFSGASEPSAPTVGARGSDGSVGDSGAGCSSPLGDFLDGVWVAGVAGEGSAGTSGSGGGGGGGGSGLEFEWEGPLCDFVDGLGGGGGGGGAAGCGGEAGGAGQSAGVSIALLLVRTPGGELPRLSDVRLRTADGREGGAGGGGGSGALGSPGALGGMLDRALRTTPSLGVPYAGARGGNGGNGGSGGGGGGGCGGSVVGVWVQGAGITEGERASLLAGTSVALGRPGAGGPGGPGETIGGAGMSGEARDVYAR